MIPWGVCFWSRQGLSIVRKCPVHPVSAMAKILGGVQRLLWVNRVLLGITALVDKHHVVAAPACQMVLVRSLSLPPMALSRVAAF